MSLCPHTSPILEFAQSYLMAQIIDSKSAYEFLNCKIRYDVEEVWVLALNSQLELIKDEMIFRGTVNECSVYPRDIFRFCIQSNSTSFVLAHSHTSQNCLPSENDLKFTKKIMLASQLLEIPMVDHLILTSNNHFSFADQNVFELIKKGKEKSLFL